MLLLMLVRVSLRLRLWLSALATARVSCTFYRVYLDVANIVLDANLFKEAFEKAQEENSKIFQQ